MSDLFGDLSRQVQQGQTSLEDAWRQAQAEWAKRQQHGKPTPAGGAAVPAYRPQPSPMQQKVVARQPAPPPLPKVRPPKQRRMAVPPPLPSPSVATAPEVAYGVVSAAATQASDSPLRRNAKEVVPQGRQALFIMTEILKPPLSLRDE